MKFHVNHCPKGHIMKLTDIDLNDKTEVAAAHALLAAILGVAVSDDLSGAPSLNQTTSELGTPQQPNAAAVFGQPGQLPPGAAPLQDAAAIFGGPSAGPLPGTLQVSSGMPVGSATFAPGQALGLLPNTGISGAPGVAFVSPEVHAQSHAAAAALAGAGGSAAGMPELDDKGLPWDERIHASTKTKTKAGIWTAKRGVNDAALVGRIEAELRARVQAMNAGGHAGSPSAIPLPGAGAAQPTGLPAQSLVMSGPASSGAGAQPGVSAIADPVTFEQLMPRVTQATVAGILPPTALQQVCALLGLPSVVALQTNPAYVPHAWAQLKAAFPAMQ